MKLKKNQEIDFFFFIENQNILIFTYRTRSVNQVNIINVVNSSIVVV